MPFSINQFGVYRWVPPRNGTYREVWPLDAPVNIRQGAKDVLDLLEADELLGLKHARIRWFKPDDGHSGGRTFDDRPDLKGRVCGREPSTIWLLADLRPDELIHVVSHEAFHSKAFADFLNGERADPPGDEDERAADEFADYVLKLLTCSERELKEIAAWAA